MAYTTTADLKTYLGVDAATDDALLSALISRASAVIDAYCLRTFEAASNTTRVFDESAVVGSRLMLDRDLCAINSITNGDAVVVAADEYSTQPRSDTPYWAIDLLQSSSKSWKFGTYGEDTVSISGKWAYSETAPDAIVQACTRLAAYMYRQKDNARDTGGDIVVDGSVARAVTIPADVKAILQPFRRAVI